MFRFQYTLSEHDFFEFNKYHAFNSPISKKNMLVQRFKTPVIYIACGVSLWAVVDRPILSYYFLISFGFAAIFWIVFYKWLVTRKIKKNFKKLKKNIKKITKSGKLPFPVDMTLSFEDDFIFAITEEGETKIKYSAIDHIAITEEAIYIYISATQAEVVPLSVFSDSKNRDDFLRFIEEKHSMAQ